LTQHPERGDGQDGFDSLFCGALSWELAYSADFGLHCKNMVRGDFMEENAGIWILFQHST
jgi:hypothetical protein